MSSANNKRDRRNIGGHLGIDRKVPSLGAAHQAIVNIEFLLFTVFKDEIARFAKEPDELRRFFNHYFSILPEARREEFVTNFQRRTPEIVLGYTRTSSTFPCFAIVLEDEQEAQNYVGDYMGQHDDEEDGDRTPYSNYNGATWETRYGIYIYAEHPDVCLYLYHFAKMLLIGSAEWLLSNGVSTHSITGAELAPDDNYIPENMFVRVLRMSAQAAQTVPYLTLSDPRRLRLLGLYREDVVVDGLRGGVKTPRGFDGNDEDEDDDP